MKASQLPNQLLFKIQLPVLSLSPHQIHVKKPNCLSVWEQPLVPETMSTTTIHAGMPGLSNQRECFLSKNSDLMKKVKQTPKIYRNLSLSCCLMLLGGIIQDSCSIPPEFSGSNSSPSRYHVFLFGTMALVQWSTWPDKQIMFSGISKRG